MNDLRFCAAIIASPGAKYADSVAVTITQRACMDKKQYGAILFWDGMSDSL
jgi:hypothetical protein